jgi:methylated-DNA-[protein]-cysteine S-methyltransferase
MRLARVDTALGDVWISYTEKGLYSLDLPGNLEEEGLAREEGPGTKNPPGWISAFVGRLQAFLQGESVDFTSFPVDYSGYTFFTTKVLQEARLIPYGCVASYGSLAAATGAPLAYRAVGNCMNRNRTPLVIPCHRVIKNDGQLGGFGSGVNWKRTLLELEGVKVTENATVKLVGERRLVR